MKLLMRAVPSRGCQRPGLAILAACSTGAPAPSAGAPTYQKILTRLPADAPDVPLWTLNVRPVP